MMIDLTQGPNQSVLSDGSHPLLGQSSIVHEESGYRPAFSRTAYKVMTVDPTSSAPAPSVPPCNVCFNYIVPDQLSLAPCSGRQGRCAPPRGGGLRPALTALARGAQQASVGMKGSASRSNKGINLLTPHHPYKGEVVVERKPRPEERRAAARLEGPATEPA